MISMRTEVNAEGLSAKAVTDFMIDCTDEAYQKWWKGVHIAFHTIRRYQGNLGNAVYFDEYVGKRRLKFKGVVVKYTAGSEIVWQMKKVVMIPAWLSLSVTDEAHGVRIVHTLCAGFTGIGRIFDMLLRIYLSKGFERQLREHARTEFAKLAEML